MGNGEWGDCHFYGNTLSGFMRNVNIPTYDMPFSSVHRREAPDMTTIFLKLSPVLLMGRISLTLPPRSTSYL